MKYAPLAVMALLCGIVLLQLLETRRLLSRLDEIAVELVAHDVRHNLEQEQ